jgi:hypothetical protein
MATVGTHYSRAILIVRLHSRPHHREKLSELKGTEQHVDRDRLLLSRHHMIAVGVFIEEHGSPPGFVEEHGRRRCF